jgi:hypothetical protein
LKIKAASDLPEHIRALNSTALNWKLPATANGHKHKYGAKETWVDNIRFPSKLEARCYEELKLRQAAGEVRWFVMQVPFHLGGGVKHKVDFLAVLSSGGVELIEAKGQDLGDGKARRRQVEARYGVKIRIWTGK